MGAKEGLRTVMKMVRDRMSSNEVESLSERIVRNFLNLEEVVGADSFFVYVSTGNEVQTHDLIKKLLKENKMVTVPKILGEGHMEPYQITDFSQLEPGKYGILSPVAGCQYVGHLEIGVVPSVALTEEHHRLGMGGGYYDRFLEKHLKKHPGMITVALAYNAQIIPRIPMEITDQLVDIIVTEDNVG